MSSAASHGSTAGEIPSSEINGLYDAERNGRMSTLGILCAISVIRGADVQLLPSSFRAMEADLGLKPYALGAMALCQGVACAAAGPFWGNLVDSGASRKLLLTVGSGCWGTCTLLLGFVSGFGAMCSLRVMNGVALAMLLPVSQSFIVDLCPKAERGYMFGWLFFFASLGQVLACLFVTPISNDEVFGHQGWRFALIVVGLLSWVVMLFVPCMLVEEQRIWKPERVGIRKEFRKLGRFLRVPTFGVIILQGIFGTIPGAALSFLTMYFQYTGISDSMAALINSLRIIGDACGGLLGGIIGDMLTVHSPAYGRALTAQFSILASLPFIYLIFMVVPRRESMVGTYAGLLFMHGLTSSWVTPGCICPVMCDIVPRRSLASAYAWELALVFCSGNSIGPLMVGMMSQRLFGYRLSTEQIDDMPPEDRAQNAKALGKALFFSSALPYAICALLFSLLYFTYSRDCKRAELSEEMGGGSGSSTDGEKSQKPSEHSQLISRRTLQQATKPLEAGVIWG